jgi:O-antigen ligase
MNLINHFPIIKINVDQIKLFILQLFLICGIILFREEHKYLVLFLYIVVSVFCILNTKHMLYIFYSSIWISFKLYFEIGSVIVRLSDFIFLFIFISWLINSITKKKLIISTPKKNDYVIIGFIILCIFSLITSLNKIGTISEIIQILQLIFLYYLVKSIVDNDVDIKYFMLATVIFGIIDSFWVFSEVINNGIGERYIGILEIVPDELPYSILFLYLFYLSEKNTFLKAVELFFLLFLTLSMILTMGRGLLIITVVMFFSATLIHFITKKKYLNLIMVSITAIIISAVFISSSQLAATRYGSIVKGGENTNMRLYNWYSSTLIIQKYPFTGVGLGNDTEYLKAYLPEFSPEIVKKFGGDTPHNEIFHFGIQTGIIGMLFVVFFYFSLIRRSFKNLFQNKLQSETIAISLFSLSLGVFIWSLGNDVILAGKGSFAILITAFIDKIYQNENSIKT